MFLTKQVSLSDLSGVRNSQSGTSYFSGSKDQSRRFSNRKLSSVSIPDSSTGPIRSTSSERSFRDLTVPFQPSLLLLQLMQFLAERVEPEIHWVGMASG